MMKKVGDGTGLGSMPETEEGLSHVGGDETEKPTGPYAHGAVSQPKLDPDGGNRTTPLRGGEKGMKKE